MTLKEIAKEANVSISTVSRVINQKNTKAASPQVQERIWEIVRKSGYTPNSTARALKLGANAPVPETVSKTIACFYARGDVAVSDLFFSHIAKAIEQEAFKSNFFMKHSFTALDIANPEIVARIVAVPVDGAVILGRYDNQMLRFFTEHYKHVVYAGLNPMGTKYDQVVCEGRDITFSAVSYLHELGHTKIGYIGEQSNEVRYTAFKESLEKLGLPFLQKNTANVKLSHEGGYQGAYHLMNAKSDITAIFCANDNTAIGAIKALRERGYRIPEDISVICFDDMSNNQLVDIPISHIRMPLSMMGQRAVQYIANHAENPDLPPLHLTMEADLVINSSCKNINREKIKNTLP